MDYILTTQGLTKTYHKYKAIDSVNLHIAQGDIYGFIGRNGAGKTTTLKILGGLSTASSGDFSLFGYTNGDIRKEHVFSRIGLLIEEPGLYPDMSAYDNLKMKCLCTGINRPGYIEEILKLVGLSGTGRKKTKDFSLGMRQRLGIGLALVGDPDILLLDEPINGLDPQGIAEIRHTLLKLNKERNITIVISSHILEELSKIATRYGIIHEGRLVAEMTSEELQECCQEKIEIQVKDIEKATTKLESMGITQYKVVSEDTIHIYDQSHESAEIGMALAKADIPFSTLKMVSDSLEEYYLNLTGGAGNA